MPPQPNEYVLSKWHILHVWCPELRPPHHKFCICICPARHWYFFINSDPPFSRKARQVAVEIANFELHCVQHDSFIDTTTMQMIPVEHIAAAIATEDGRRGALRRLREESGKPTLGIIRPHQIKRLIIEPIEADWSDEQLASLQRNDLFQKAPEKTLEKIPFNFKYEFTCGDMACNGHTMMCTDWEMGEAYRRWRADYGDGWEAAFRNRFEKEMIEKFDTHFFVGTVHQHPGSWIIIGLFYPPKPKPDLFAQ